MILNNLLIIPEFEKKLLIQNLYSKFIVRFVEKKIDRKRLILVDNNNSIFFVQLKGRFLKRFFKRLNKGISFFSMVFIYRKRKRTDSQFTFEHILLKSPQLSINHVNFLLTKLQSLRSNKKFLIVVRPCRGGVRCIFNSLKGIFPRKHLLFFLAESFFISSSINSLSARFRLKLVLAKLKIYNGRQLVIGFTFLRFLIRIHYSFFLKRSIRLSIQKIKRKRMSKRKRKLKLKFLRRMSQKAIRFICFSDCTIDIE